MSAIVDPAIAIHAADAIRALAVAVVWIGIGSLLSEPVRMRSQAIIVAAAAGAYFDGGFGAWELGAVVLIAVCAYRGVTSYAWIGVAWALHTLWDVAHHMAGMPIISWLPTSSFECAVTDAVLAAWFFAGAPDTWRLFRDRAGQKR